MRFCSCIIRGRNYQDLFFTYPITTLVNIERFTILSISGKRTFLHHLSTHKPHCFCMKKSHSLSSKLMSVVGMLFVLIALVFIGVSYALLDRTESEIGQHVNTEVVSQIQKTVSAKASQYAAQTEALINSAHFLPYTLASQLSASIEASDALSLNREQTQRLVKSVLNTGTTSSMYAQFETNLFDGNAEANKTGKIHSTPGTGSFEVYFIRSNNGLAEQVPITDPELKHDTRLDEFGFRAAEWYLCNKETRKPCVSNPYQYEIREGYTELMTSLTVPVIANNQFRGVVGTDLNLPIIQKRAENLKASLYNGNAEVYVISQNGLVVAATNATSKLARPFSEVFADKAKSETLLSANKQAGLLENDGMLYVSEDIDLDLAGVKWKMIVGVSKAHAMAPVTSLETMISTAVTSLLTTQFIVAVVCTVIALVLVFLFTKSIIQPVRQVAARMEELAGQGGDLTQDIHVHSHAELIQLSEAFNHFKESVREMLDQAKQSCSHVIEQSGETQAHTQSTNELIQVQQAEIDSVVTAITEMSQTAQEVARTAADAANNADNATDSVKQTETEISEATRSVVDLSQEMQNASTAVQAVSQRSADIKKILDVIGAIADQTNLLALNAAIEAARAGDNGRGFSVVADEVRSLASKTAESVEEIGNVITALQGEVDHTVETIYSGSQKANDASHRSQSALDKMQTTVLQIGEISERMTQMAAAAEEQSQVSEELNRNMVVIGNATSEVATNSEASAASSKAINNAVSKLAALLAKLKTHQ